MENINFKSINQEITLLELMYIYGIDKSGNWIIGSHITGNNKSGNDKFGTKKSKTEKYGNDKFINYIIEQ